MMLQRWDPFVELRRMEEQMGRVWSGFADNVAERGAGESWTVPLDVVEEADNIVVHATVPGINPDDLKVEIEDGVLTIRGQTKEEHEAKNGSYLLRERRVGSFYRAVRLPDTVDADKARTDYHSGVLTITLPKQEAKKAKQLKVHVG